MSNLSPEVMPQSQEPASAQPSAEGEKEGADGPRASSWDVILLMIGIEVAGSGIECRL
jgi:hypothetical protein